MLIHKEKNYIPSKFIDEAEIENVVESNSDFIFGPDSIYLPKAKIKSADGVGTVPDGFVIDLTSKQWFIVEAELSIHSVWNHIAPQISKQIIASQQPLSRKILLESAVQIIKDSPILQEKFDFLGIQQIDIRQILSEIFEKKPIIGLPIDSISNDLREWAQTLKNEVKLWIIRKLVDVKDSSDIIYEIPDEYQPVFDTGNDESNGRNKSSKEIIFFDVQIIDLLENGLIKPGEEIFLSYKPKGGQKRDFKGIINPDGSISVEGKEYSSLSYAALFCIQDAGSTRETVNGWTSWKTVDGAFLANVRDEFLKKKKNT